MPSFVNICTSACRSRIFAIASRQSLIDQHPLQGKRGKCSTLPAVRSIIGEGRIELLTRDGTTIGNLVISDKGSAWGLTPFMHRRGVEGGDAVILTIDADLECAVIESGPLELIGAYQDGEGLGPYQVLDEITRPDHFD